MSAFDDLVQQVQDLSDAVQALQDDDSGLDHESRIQALENPDQSSTDQFPLDPNLQSAIEQTQFQKLFAITLIGGTPIYTVARNISQNPPQNGESWIELISGVYTVYYYVNGTKVSLKNFTTGTATLVGGTLVKSDSNITATSVIIFSRNIAHGTLGNLSLASQGSSTVTFNSDNALDTSTINYIVIN